MVDEPPYPLQDSGYNESVLWDNGRNEVCHFYFSWRWLIPVGDTVLAMLHFEQYKRMSKEKWTCLGVKLQFRSSITFALLFPSVFPLGSVVAPFKCIREKITFNVTQQRVAQQTWSKLKRNRVLPWDMFVFTVHPCRTVEKKMNIHSQLSACQFRLPQNKTKTQALHRGPWTFSLKPDYKLLQLPGLGGDNRRRRNHTHTHTHHTYQSTEMELDEFKVVIVTKSWADWKTTVKFARSSWTQKD